MKIFAVYDSKAEAYLQPYFAQTLGTAVRMFTSAAQDQESTFHKHAEDYTLFELGEFDEYTGKITGLNAPKSHCNAMIVAQKEN